MNRHKKDKICGPSNLFRQSFPVYIPTGWESDGSDAVHFV